MITFEDFSAPDPEKKSTCFLSNCLKELSLIFMTHGANISVRLLSYTAVKTSVLLASIMGQKSILSAFLFIVAITDAAITSRVFNKINGMFNAKHMPLALAIPTRKPVYEPGPEVTETADSWSIVDLLNSNKFFIPACKNEACS